ncbi:Ubiquitin-conjugating enzyme, variant 2 [Balamuthia mandrillaris]
MAAKKDYVRRLRKELQQLIKEPVPHIEALPNPNNILEWHYVITGPSGTPYQGGLYHGKLKFPSEYPLKPPGILMLTPNGRFKTNSRLCLSMSDFHPETWNPLWSVGSILTGLLSFMLEDKPTAGSIQTSDSEKRQFARHSMEFNKKDPMFKKLFSHLIERYEREAQEEAAKQAAASEGQEAGGGGETPKQQQGTASVLVDVITLLAFLLLVFVLLKLFYLS